MQQVTTFRNVGGALVIAVAAITALACGRHDSENAKGVGTSASPVSKAAPLPASAGPVDRMLYSKASACYNCAQKACTEQVKQCETIEGQATGGPSAGKSRADLCQSTLDCVLKQHCVTKQASVKCYCGSANGEKCFTAGPDGPCKAAIEAGLETTDTKAVALDYLKPKTGGGSAMGLVHCLIDNHCRACF